MAWDRASILLTANDDTKAAIESVKAGLRSLDERAESLRGTLDLEKHCLEVFYTHAETGHQEVQGIERPGVSTPVVLPDVSIDLKGLF